MFFSRLFVTYPVPQPSLTMSTYCPAVSKRPSISRRFSPLSMTCVSPSVRGFPGRGGRSRNPSKLGIELLQLLLGCVLNIVVEGIAVRVDADGERTKVAHAEFPQALGHQVFPLDLLDLLDLRRLERRGTADDREIDHPVLAHRLDRLVRETALAGDRAHAVALAEGVGEAHHSRGGRRTDADRLVLSGRNLAYARRGVQEERAAQIHRRLDAVVEDADVRAVADGDEVSVHA